MNNTIPFHSATHAPQITVDVNILTMLKQAASCLTEAAGKDVYLAAIGPDMELTIIMEEDAPSVLPCFDEDDAVPGAREEILTGRIKATDAEITALAKTPKAEIPAALAELRKPKQERQPRKAETSSSKQTLSEISKSIQGHQRQLTAEERTSLKASIDNRYQERAVANGSLMMCEVQGAKEDFIRRWNSIFKEYPDVFEDSDCRKIIHDLTEDAVQYLLKIKEKTL